MDSFRAQILDFKGVSIEGKPELEHTFSQLDFDPELIMEGFGEILAQEKLILLPDPKLIPFDAVM